MKNFQTLGRQRQHTEVKRCLLFWGLENKYYCKVMSKETYRLDEHLCGTTKNTTNNQSNLQGKKKIKAGAFTCIDFKTHYNDSVTKKCIS